MKNSLIVTIFIVCNIYFGQAQNLQSSYINTSTGYAFTGDGDLDGINFQFLYGKYVSRRISIGIGASYTNFPYRQTAQEVLPSDFVYFSNSKNLFSIFYFDVINKGKSCFKVGFKPGLKYWSATYITGPEISYGNIVPESSTYQDNFSTFYYALNLNYTFSLNAKLGLFISCETGNDLNESNVVGINIGTVFKL